MLTKDQANSAANSLVSDEREAQRSARAEARNRRLRAVGLLYTSSALRRFERKRQVEIVRTATRTVAKQWGANLLTLGWFCSWLLVWAALRFPRLGTGALAVTALAFVFSTLVIRSYFVRREIQALIRKQMPS